MPRARGIQGLIYSLSAPEIGLAAVSLLHNIVMGENFERDVNEVPKEYLDDLRAYLKENGPQRTRASFETFI